MGSSVVPTHLVAGVGRDEVQEIDLSSEVGFQVQVRGVSVGIFLTEPYYAQHSGAFPEANAKNLQEATSVRRTERVKVKKHGKVVRRNGKVVYRTKKVKENVASTLAMPNEFVGQNGAEIHQVTPITVTGCAKAKPAKKAKKKKKKAAKKGKKR